MSFNLFKNPLPSTRLEIALSGTRNSPREEMKSELESLGESIAEVLRNESSSLRLHEFINGKPDLPSSIWKLAAELGWLGIGLPEEDGGLGMGSAGLAVLHRELGRRTAPGPFIATLCLAQWLSTHGSAEQKDSHLARIIAGELSAAIPAAPVGTAERLSLRKGSVQGSAPHMLGSAGAGVALVAFTDEGGQEGWGLVAIDGRQARLTRSSQWDMTREFCRLDCDNAPVSRLEIEDFSVATESLVGEFALAVVNDSLGGMEASVENTVAYLKERVQFDKPLASFQALKHRAANLAAKIETTRELSLHAVEAAAGSDSDATFWALMAKASCTDDYVWVTQDCLQLFGGVGFTWEYDCHLYLKRARLNQLLVGSSGYCRDEASRRMVAATRAGRNITEMSL
jgi:alkylation response protein AidB-like acyl-CoA dehydrogenase